jgi:H+/Cl- antiporter ClcA
VVTASISLVTALIYALTFTFFEYLVAIPLLAWDAIVTILWAAVLGVFGSMYINENPEMDAGIQRMKNAVYWDAANLALWAIGVIYLVVLYTSKSGKRMYEGKKRVNDQMGNGGSRRARG